MSIASTHLWSVRVIQHGARYAVVVGATPLDVTFARVAEANCVCWQIARLYGAPAVLAREPTTEQTMPANTEGGGTKP